MVRVLLVAQLLALSSCASRGALGRDGRLAPLADPYSRNWVVAGPTLVGNVVGGALGAPGYLAMWPFASCSDPPLDQQCNWASDNMGWAIVGPALVIGFVTGTPFLPLAYLLPERPIEIHK
jgi:hypothetical protein